MKSFLPHTLQQVLICILVVVLIAAVIPIGIFGYRINKEVTPIKIRNLINSLQNIGDSATLNANSYGEVATATRDTLNKHAAPGIDRMVMRFDSTMIRVEKKVELLEPLLIALTNNSNNLSSLLVNTNRRVNDDKGLLPTTTAMIDGLRLLTENELRDVVAEFALAERTCASSPSRLRFKPAQRNRSVDESLNRSAGQWKSSSTQQKSPVQTWQP